VGIIEVDRTARAAIHNSVNRQARELLAHKRSLIIYPEGTRPRDGVMRPFKKGAFTMAISSQLPVLPLSIHGTYEAAAPGKPWFRGGPVTAIIDPPIPTVGMTGADADSLRDRVREIIAKRVADLGGAVGSAQS
jgi:1-acyl-sn-glycerol-3-phosphate acyltransferase